MTFQLRKHNKPADEKYHKHDADFYHNFFVAHIVFVLCLTQLRVDRRFDTFIGQSAGDELCFSVFPNEE